MVGALRDPARDPAVREPRRRPIRPTPRHPVRDPRDYGDVGRARAAVGHRHRPGRPGVGAVLHHGDGLPVGREATRDRRHRHLRRRDLPHRPVAARGSRLRRSARRRHRDGVVGDPVHPGHRPRGRARHGVPAHTELHDAGQERPARPGGDQSAQGACSGAPPGDARVAGRRHRADTRGLGAPRRRRSAGGAVRESVGVGDAVRDGCRVQRPLGRPRRQRHRGRIRAGPYPPGRGRYRGGRAVVAPEPSVRHEASLPRHRLLRDVQPRQRHAGRRPLHPDHRDHRDRHPDDDRRVRRRRHRVRHRFRRHDRAAPPPRHHRRRGREAP